VLAVHLAFGLAPHMGQRTDNICFNVSFPGFTTIVSSMVGLRDGQSSSVANGAVPKQESGPTRLFCRLQGNYLMDRNRQGGFVWALRTS
jgi:hypothetical protein